jgi:hypothetical protein
MADKVALRQIISEYVCFLCQFSFHQLLHIHYPIKLEITSLNCLLVSHLTLF